MSTADLGKILGKFALWIATPAAVPRGPPRALRAALAPHSSRVVCARGKANGRGTNQVMLEPTNVDAPEGRGTVLMACR